MAMIAKVAATVQATLGELAEELARNCPVIKRKRKFTATSLAQTFVFGFLANPNARDENLAQTAATLGVVVTTQAVEQRFSEDLAAFLEALFRKAVRCAIGAETVLAPLLERFPAVYVLDSSTITLPDTLRDRFPGCGGSHGGGQAAMKIQIRWDLGSGALDAVAIEPGRDCDYKTPLQTAASPRGALRITDLGYFDTKVFQRLSDEGCYWLSRLHFGTSVFDRDGMPLRLLDCLAKQSGPVVDWPIRIGMAHKVACRLIAWRVPKKVADQRRHKLIVETRRKDGRTPSRERLAWCDWTILVTNAPDDLLTPSEIAVLYRARWQIELLFKRWKSQGLVAELTGSTAVRQMVRLWSRLLAVLLQHWLLLATVWGDPRYSLAKASEAIRPFALQLAAASGDAARIAEVIETLRKALRATARQNKRKRHSTFQLLNEPSSLGYFLT